jgi:hypothetical protein
MLISRSVLRCGVVDVATASVTLRAGPGQARKLLPTVRFS